MASGTDIKQRILEKALDQFLQFGFTKVTMDELAAELGMSKKTLYKWFPTKESLLQAVVEMKHEEIQNGIDGILLNEGMDFVEKLKRYMAFLGEQLSKYRAPFMRDIQRNAPEIWKQMEDFRREKVLSDFGKLLDEGVQKQVLRGDCDQQLVILMYLSSIQGLINPEVLSQLSFSATEVFETITKVLFEGILTDKARAKYRVGRPASFRTRKETPGLRS